MGFKTALAKLSFLRDFKIQLHSKLDNMENLYKIIVDTPVKKTQAYYDDLVQEWAKGKTYYNPRNGNSTHIDLSRNATYIFKGEIPPNAIVDGRLVKHDGVRLMCSTAYDDVSRTLKVTKRLPNKNVWPTFTTANSASQIYRCG